MIVPAPPTIAAIAQRVHQQERGIALYHVHRVFDVHAGPFRRHDELDLAVVVADGETIKVRVIRASVGGKDQDAAALQTIASQYEHPKPGDVFHRPFDPRYVDEYHTEQLDAATFRFTSPVRDGAHGTGSFTLDPMGNVVAFEFTPNVLPKYASSGLVRYERGAVLPGLWSVTRELHVYSGHYAVFGGGATADISYDHFKQFADVRSALAALGAGEV